MSATRRKIKEARPAKRSRTRKARPAKEASWAKDRRPPKEAGHAKQARQVAALPLRRNRFGETEVCLITSRETRQWLIPKGWPTKGIPDHVSAAREAEQEAGVFGRMCKKPIGRYRYLKRLPSHSENAVVTVYRLDAMGRLAVWPEKFQREVIWVDFPRAVELVQDPGLRNMLEEVGRSLDEGSGKPPEFAG